MSAVEVLMCVQHDHSSSDEKTLTTLHNVIAKIVEHSELFMLSRNVVPMVMNDLRRVDAHRGDERDYRDEGGDGSEVFHSFERNCWKSQGRE